MAGRLHKRDRKKTIEQLALRYFNTMSYHGRMGVRSKMRQTFGRKATSKALTQMADVLSICDPNFERPAQL